MELYMQARRKNTVWPGQEPQGFRAFTHLKLHMPSKPAWSPVLHVNFHLIALWRGWPMIKCFVSIEGPVTNLSAFLFTQIEWQDFVLKP